MGICKCKKFKKICKDCWHPFECCHYGETPEKCFKYQKEQKPNKK